MPSHELSADDDTIKFLGIVAEVAEREAREARKRYNDAVSGQESNDADDQD